MMMMMIVVIVMMLLLCRIQESVAAHNFSCPPPALYSFGDSLADTGNLEYVFPFESPAEKQPYGELPPFRKPSFRYSDGRLAIDFLAQAFSLPFLTPYMQVITPDYSHGCNFAVAGSTAASITPFSLQTQVNQFIRFRTTVIQTEAQTLDEENTLAQKIPSSNSFGDSLYIISIGGNDFLYSSNFYAPTGFLERVVTPRTLNAVSNAVETLYNENARFIMVWNIPPQGCAPILLTLYGPMASSDDYDSLGCLKPYNEPIQIYNEQLKQTVQSLQQNLSDAQIIYADYYAANMDILHNATLYGFDPNSTLKACCGKGGQYNYNASTACGNPEVPACPDPSKFVNWDGVHFTEAFYRLIANFFLTGHYLTPSINISSTCNLNFTAF